MDQNDIRISNRRICLHYRWLFRSTDVKACCLFGWAWFDRNWHVPPFSSNPEMILWRLSFSVWCLLNLLRHLYFSFRKYFFHPAVIFQQDSQQWFWLKTSFCAAVRIILITSAKESACKRSDSSVCIPMLAVTGTTNFR